MIDAVVGLFVVLAVMGFFWAFWYAICPRNFPDEYGFYEEDYTDVRDMAYKLIGQQSGNGE